MAQHYKRQETDDFLRKLTDTDNANDLALPVNTPAQAEFLLHRLEQAAGSIGLYVNANKTFMCFKQEGAIYFKVIGL